MLQLKGYFSHFNLEIPMEQHPVPRNISSFQFHLVGDMTLRQFLYLAGGAVCGFLIIKFFPLSGLLKWPMAAVFTFGGLAFAFLPIQERPLDKWLLAFIKSINSPTQYLWQKEAHIPDVLLKSYYTSVIKTLPQSHQQAHTEAKKKLEMYLSSLPATVHQTINSREKSYLDSTLNLFSQADSGPQAMSANSVQAVLQPISQPGFTKPQTLPVDGPINIPSRPVKIELGRQVVANVKTAPIGKTSVKEEKEEIITKILEAKPETIKSTVPETKIEFNPPTFAEASAGKPIIQISAPRPDATKLENVVKEKEKLEQELKKLKEELIQSQAVVRKAEVLRDKPDVIKPQAAPEKKEPTIKTVTPKTALDEFGIPKLPQVPNLIMGVIKDTQGKQLPNIILTIKDTKGTPQRALKTNRLGQFSTATPLQNGTYFIEAEDPLKRYIFDIAEINLTGKVFLPIEMDAKGEKELMREKLTKEIFGTQGATL